MEPPDNSLTLVTQQPDVCVLPAVCGRRRRCVREQAAMREGDLGAMRASPCFLSLLRSVFYELAAEADVTGESAS